MCCNVLVVEDEIFVAIEIENAVEDLGHRPIGIAADSSRALQLSEAADVALVDVNLVDGPSGIELGRKLAADGVTVLYMTANPGQLGAGVAGTIGVIPKPVNGGELRASLEYAVAVHTHDRAAVPPRRLKLFARGARFAA